MCLDRDTEGPELLGLGIRIGDSMRVLWVEGGYDVCCF